MHNEQAILNELTKEVQRRLFDESFPRIEKCLSLLTEEEVWQQPNEELSSIGHLVLHLCGNARQYIVSGIGGAKDQRQRQHEFEAPALPKAKLLELLSEVRHDILPVLHALTPQQLNRPIKVQGFDETTMSILIHVVEHCSYHTGQITVHTKLLKNIDLKYYGNLDLNQTNTSDAS